MRLGLVADHQHPMGVDHCAHSFRYRPSGKLKEAPLGFQFVPMALGRRRQQFGQGAAGQVGEGGLSPFLN